MAESLPLKPRIDSGPAYNAKAANLSDTLPLTNGPCRGIAFDVVGAIKLVTAKGDTVIIPSGVLAAGQIHALSAQQIWSSGTTATNIWVFY